MEPDDQLTEPDGWMTVDCAARTQPDQQRHKETRGQIHAHKEERKGVKRGRDEYRESERQREKKIDR